MSATDDDTRRTRRGWGGPPLARRTLCSIARGAPAMSRIFLGPALLRLAQDASVCDDDGSGSSSSSS
jgi:hypothetical protein